MTTQEECDYADKLNAARAMLAALKAAADIIGHPDDAMSKHICAAIAQAEKAGITTGDE